MQKEIIAKSRKIHRVSAGFAGVPILLIVITGILLQVKIWVPWIQPPSQKGSVLDPSLSLNVLLDASKTVSAADVLSWSDIRSIDIRPSSKTARVRTSSEYEITIDLGTGKVIQAAPRRTGILIELHEGKFFGDMFRYGVFLPSAILLLVIWITGLCLLVLPKLKRKK